MPTPRGNVSPCGMTLRDFQKQITDWCVLKNPRRGAPGLVRVVYYNINNIIGKSVLAKHLEYHNLATIIPRNYTKNYMDFITFGRDGQSVIIVFPQKFLSCSERIKWWNGIKDLEEDIYCVESWRRRIYGNSKAWGPIQIIVFTHVMPHFSFLQSDSWMVYEVLPEYVLQEIDVEGENGNSPQQSRTPYGAFSRWLAHSEGAGELRTKELRLCRDPTEIYLYSFTQEEGAWVCVDKTLSGLAEPVGTCRAILVAPLEKAD